MCKIVKLREEIYELQEKIYKLQKKLNIELEKLYNINVKSQASEEPYVLSFD